MKTFTKIIALIAFVAISQIAQAGSGSASANNAVSSISGGVAATGNSNSGSGTLRNGGNSILLLANPVISGPTLSVCPGQVRTYTSSIVPGATTYTWVVPSYCSIVSGQGSPSVDVSFAIGFVQGYLRVTASSATDMSHQTVVTVYSTPSTPLPIDGPETGACAGGTYVYSIPPVASANSYTWYAPTGCVIASPVSSGNPLTTTVTSVNITFPTGFHLGVVSVRANSGCGSTILRTKNVRSVLVSPGDITGRAFGLCDESNEPYSIAPVANATGYTWSTFPTTGVTIHNNGTTNITIDFDNTFVWAYLYVTADNSCGHGDTRYLTLYAHPDKTIIPGGPTGACNNNTSASIAYYSVNPVYNTSNYHWTVPTGANIVSGDGTTDITVDFMGASSGDVTCRAENSCGRSSTSVKAVVVNSCRLANGEESQMQLGAYPNPAKDKLTVSFTASSTEMYSIQMFDMMGRSVVNLSGASSEGINKQEINLQNISTGLYNLVIKKGDTAERLRVVVE